MTNTKSYINLHPGPLGALKHKDLYLPLEEGAGGGMAANLIAQLFNKNTFPIVGGGRTYNAGDWTVTTTGTGAAAAAATGNGGGVDLTCGSSSTFNTNLQSQWGWTPAADLLIAFLCRVKISDVTAAGFSLGLGNSQVDPATTDYTDGIYFRKAATAATITGRVRGNSGVAAATAGLVSEANATEYELGFVAKLNATKPQGYWTMNGQVTAFTANQLAQLEAILTTPPTMFLNLSAKGSAGNPVVTVVSELCMIDN